MTVLHYQLFQGPQAQPSRSVLLLHGLLGSSANWRSFARRLSESLPEWAAVTVDLRMHGQSQDQVPPHSLGRAAEDLMELSSRLPVPVTAVVGHSLGGKVALAFLARVRPQLSQVVVLDSNPGPLRHGHGVDSTLSVLDALESVHFPVPSHQTFWEMLQGRGLSLPVAQWLGMNLQRSNDGYRFALSLPAIRELLEDYSREDLWSVIDPPPAGVNIGFLLGGRSEACSAETRTRLERIAASSSNFHVAVLPDAGHWVHVDEPEETYRFVTQILEKQPSLSPR